jgi:endonuclease/exonuclease/phosphatase family metal-dependent hydrolase
LWLSGTDGSLGAVRVVSLNAWCGGMLESLVQWLPGCGADVLCVQEVTWTDGHDGWVTYADGDRTSRQRASLFEDLRRALPGHQAQFFTCDTGPVLAEDGAVLRQHFGIATLVAPHLAIVGSDACFVHGTFAQHDAWPSEGRGRMAHAVRVAHPDGRCATVAHLHGVRMASGKGDTPQRLRQAEQLAALLARVRRPGDLAVVAGDLNILPDSETFEVLGRVGLSDMVGQTDTRTSAYAKPGRHASYLLVSDRDAVASFEVLATPEVSDHRPLVLDLRRVSSG